MTNLEQLAFSGYTLKYVNCDLCGADNTIFLGSREAIFDLEHPQNKLDIKIFKCKECGLIYPNPLPLADKEQFQINYSDPQKYFPVQIDEVRIKQYEDRLRIMDRFLAKKGLLLDIGCGRGELVFAAQRLGWQACGIDPSQAFIEYGRKNLGVDVKQGRLEEFNFPAEYFDAVCLSGVLQYVDTPKKLIAELSRVTKKNGIIYIEDTNTDALVLILGDLFFKLSGKKKTTRIYPEPPKFETYGFSPKTLSAYLEQAGFKVVLCRVWGGSAGIPKLNRSFSSSALCVLRKAIVVFGRFIGRGNMFSIYALKT